MQTGPPPDNVDSLFTEFSMDGFNKAPSKAQEAALKRAEGLAKKQAAASARPKAAPKPAAAAKTTRRKATTTTTTTGTKTPTNTRSKDAREHAALCVRIDRMLRRFSNKLICPHGYTHAMTTTQLRGVLDSLTEQMNTQGAEQMMHTIHELLLQGIESYAARRTGMVLDGLCDIAATDEGEAMFEDDIAELAIKYAEWVARCVEQRYIQKIGMLMRDVHRRNTAMVNTDVEAMLNKPAA